MNGFLDPLRFVMGWWSRSVAAGALAICAIEVENLRSTGQLTDSTQVEGAAQDADRLTVQHTSATTLSVSQAVVRQGSLTIGGTAVTRLVASQAAQLLLDASAISTENIAASISSHTQLDASASSTAGLDADQSTTGGLTSSHEVKP